MLLPFHFMFGTWEMILPCISGGLSQEFAGSGQNRVAAKNQVQAGSSHSTARNITVAKFN